MPDSPMLITALDEDIQCDHTEDLRDNYSISPQEATGYHDARSTIPVDTNAQNMPTRYHDTRYVTGLIQFTGPLHKTVNHYGNEVENADCHDIGITDPGFNANFKENPQTDGLLPFFCLIECCYQRDSPLNAANEVFDHTFRLENGEHLNEFFDVGPHYMYNDDSMDEGKCDGPKGSRNLTGAVNPEYHKWSCEPGT